MKEFILKERVNPIFIFITYILFNRTQWEKSPKKQSVGMNF